MPIAIPTGLEIISTLANEVPNPIVPLVKVTASSHFGVSPFKRELIHSPSPSAHEISPDFPF